MPAAVSVFPARLLAGYRSFRTVRYPSLDARYRALALDGQSPSTMLIGCCDSRVPPEAIFDIGPGEMFVARNVANLVPPYTPDTRHHGTSAALEFAVLALKVSDIVVMGHGRCGGIAAALGDGERLSPGDFIGQWMELARGTAEDVKADPAIAPEDMQRVLEHEMVKTSLVNLMTFPFIRRNVERGALDLHGAWFDILEGELHVLDRATGRFHVIRHSPEPATPDEREQ